MPAKPMELSEYLERIERACRPPREWSRACEMVMENVEHVLNDHYGDKGPRVKAQGSYVQSLMIRGSDLDLVLYRTYQLQPFVVSPTLPIYPHHPPRTKKT
mmetsp:Transcript_23951/g.23705  ORF Transcript_23951/g.23705 Transcript_23951/m.23705 type:complete len:101 (-) Transcript_23951:89-391(-)